MLLLKLEASGPQIVLISLNTRVCRENWRIPDRFFDLVQCLCEENIFFRYNNIFFKNKGFEISDMPWLCETARCHDEIFLADYLKS